MIVQEQLLHFCDDVVLVEVVLRCEILAPLVDVVAPLPRPASLGLRGSRLAGSPPPE